MKKLNSNILSIGKIYDAFPNPELDSNIIELINTINKESDKEEYIYTLVKTLFEHKILEVVLYNIEHSKYSDNKEILFLKEKINNYISYKVEKVYDEHLKILKDTAKSKKIMLIKGMAIKRYYPHWYKRNQGDIDILMKNLNEANVLYENLKCDYYFEKIKLHFLKKDEYTSTIDFLPYDEKNPFIDVHITPYYMWGAVSFFKDIWVDAVIDEDFYYPSIENLILMLCAHISNQWMYRMRDINDLYCLTKDNNINWASIIARADKLGLKSILEVLMVQLKKYYNIDYCFIESKFSFERKLFSILNFGKESYLGSVILESNFLFKNYKKLFDKKTAIIQMIKNTFYMIVTKNRAFNTGNHLKKKKINEVYVLKKLDRNVFENSKKIIDNNLAICNENTNNEYFLTDFGKLYQVFYKD